MWKRVVAPVVFVTLVWILVSAATTWYISQLYESHRRVLSDNVSSIQAAGAMQDVLWRLQAVVMEAANRQASGAKAEVTQLQAAFLKHLDKAEQSAFKPEERVLVEAIRSQFAIYSEHIQRRLEPKPLVEKPPTAGEVVAQHVEETMSVAQAVAQPCKQLLELNEQLLAESTAESTQFVSMFIPIRLAFLIAGPALGILFGVWVARGLHRSVSQISVTLNDAAGELAHEVGRVNVHPSTDLPELHQQAQVVASHIRQVMGQLQKARSDGIRAERLAAVGELAAGVAHELRNPLTSVKLLVQKAAQRPPEHPLSDKQLQVVQEEITRMENTIQGLLDFARPSQLRRVPHDLRATVQRAVNLIDGRAKQQEVRIAEDLPDSPVIVDGDPEQLHQVFVNLLLNGIDAMSHGGLLQVALQSDAATAGICQVRVSDAGSGIPKAVLERIFEPFVSSKERGTGLGLAISRRIVQEHGGQLIAANQEDRGAVFTVELPTVANVGDRVDGSARSALADGFGAAGLADERPWEVASAKTADR